jgi:hypothetical protein
MIGENTSAPDVFIDTDSGIEQIRDSINDSIEEIAMLTGSNKAVYRLPLIAEQGFYRLRLTSGSIGWITDAWTVNQRYRLTQTDETKLSIQNPRWMVHTGTPREYMHIGNDVLCLYPRPSGTSDLLELTMVMIPAKYTSGTDRLKLRDSFKWASIHYAVSEFYASRGDANSATEHHQKYLMNLGMQQLYPKSAERIPYYQTIKK